MKNQYRRLHWLVESWGEPAWQPAVVLYVGYSTPAARASPRRPVERVVSCSWLVSVSRLYKRKRIENNHARSDPPSRSRSFPDS
jgi:hypothetical protein